MKRALFFVDEYMPLPSPNGTCCKHIADELISRGWEVVCVTNLFKGAAGADSIDGVEIIRVRRRLLERFSKFCDTMKGRRCEKALRMLLLQLNRVKFLFTMHRWPLVSPALGRRYLRQGLAAHAKKPFDAVVGVYYSPECLYAAHLFKKACPDVRFVGYFLDSMSGGWPPKHFTREQATARAQRMECRLCDNADLMVVMESSREHNEQCNRDMPFYNKLVYLDIPMLVRPRRLIADTGHLSDRFVNFAFVGSSLSYVRSPVFFTEVFKRIRRKNFALTIVGLTDMQELYARLKEELGDRFNYIPFVPQRQAAAIAAQADVLLNFGNNSPSMVPCKIFEYMSAGRPVISTYPIDDEPSLPYLRAYPAALLLDERRTDLDAAAAEVAAFTDNASLRVVDFDRLEKQLPKNTPRAFADIFCSLVDGDTVTGRADECPK